MSNKFRFTAKTSEFKRIDKVSQDLKERCEAAYEFCRTKVTDEQGRASEVMAVRQARVHPKIMQFASDYWSEHTKRMQFETKRSWDECSREVARREPWVYLSCGQAGHHDHYDIDLAEVTE